MEIQCRNQNQIKTMNCEREWEFSVIKLLKQNRPQFINSKTFNFASETQTFSLHACTHHVDLNLEEGNLQRENVKSFGKAVKLSKESFQHPPGRHPIYTFALLLLLAPNNSRASRVWKTLLLLPFVMQVMEV